MQHHILVGVLEMMEKVGVSKLMSSHTQIRKGRRPYRVSTLLKREKPVTDIPEILQEEVKTSAVKTAISTELLGRARDAAIRKATQTAKASGYKGMRGSVPEYLKKVSPKAMGQAETFTAAIAKKKGEAMRALHEVEPALRSQMRKAAAAGFFDEYAKIAGVGMDLRHLTKSGVTKIHMPTEESLQAAQSKLERSQRVGADLKIKPPDPNIRAVATKTK